MKKENRLKKSHDIAHVVRLRQRVSGKYYTLYYKINQEKTLIAISVSKKYGTAVERNYAKRVVREIIRPLFSSLPLASIVIVNKKEGKEIEFKEKKSDLEQIISNLNRKVKKNNEQTI